MPDELFRIVRIPFFLTPFKNNYLCYGITKNPFALYLRMKAREPVRIVKSSFFSHAKIITFIFTLSSPAIPLPEPCYSKICHYFTHSLWRRPSFLKANFFVSRNPVCNFHKYSTPAKLYQISIESSAK